MRIHYMGKYNLDPESLPHGDHMPGAVKFKEASTTKELAVIANILSLAIFIILLFIAIMRSGKLPYILGMLYPQIVFLLVLGMISVSAGAGDYYNVFNALTQMPKGSRTYLYQFNSYWYIPK